MKKLILVLGLIISFVCNVEAQRIYVYESIAICEGRKDPLGYEYGEWRKSDRYTVQLSFDELTNKLQNVVLVIDKNWFEPFYEVDIDLEKKLSNGKQWYTKKSKYGRVDSLRMTKDKKGATHFYLEQNDKVFGFILKLLDSYTDGEVVWEGYIDQ